MEQQQRIRRRFSNILNSSIAICRRSKQPADSPILIKTHSVRKSRPRLSDLFSADSDTTTTRCLDTDDRVSSSVSNLSPFEYETIVDESRTHSVDSCTSIVIELQLDPDQLSQYRQLQESSVSSNELEDYTAIGNRIGIKQRRRKWRRRRSCCGNVAVAVAVAKRSVDPYEDFKRSMVEMIVEKEMFEREELEELLLSFLGLNSAEHHKTIVLVFVDILQILFSNVCE